MMAYCSSCKHGIWVAANPEDGYKLLDRPEWKESIPCMTPLCRGRAKWMGKLVEGVPIEAVDIKKLYGMLLGLGKDPVTLQEVSKLFLNQKVVQLFAEEWNNKVVVTRMVLSDGTNVYFAPSVEGACIYRVEHADTGRDTGSTGENREEAGRGAQQAG